MITAALVALVLSGCGGTDSATSESAELPTQSAAQAAKRTQPEIDIPPTPPPQKVIVEDVIEGTGPAAKNGDNLTLQYVGYGWDGDPYADTWVYSEPPTFMLGEGRLAVGFEEGLRGMKEGGRREIVVPISRLEPRDYETEEMYENYERPGPLKPGDTLFLVVDLLAVD